MAKILVTGANGLVGNALKRQSKSCKNHEFAFIGRESFDLLRLNDVFEMFLYTQPNYVIHTAAIARGIVGNMNHHGEMFYQNLTINTNVLEAARHFRIEKLLAFSSICVFPHDLAEMQEDLMHNGPPYDANFAYGQTKRMVDVQIEAYKRQYNIQNWSSIIPANIFGPNDYYNIVNGHVIPSLIHKLYLAKKNNTPLIVYGDGISAREFVYVDDLAQILLKIIDLQNIPQRLIVSVNYETSIKDMISILCEIADFPLDNVIFDLSKPSGQRSRRTNTSLLRKTIGEYNFTPLKEGLKKSWDWFTENYPQVRQ